MKKIYFTPETKVVKIALQHIIAASPGNVTLDANGEKITDGNAVGARRFGGSFWNDDEDDDY